MEQNQKHEIALMRYSVISPLITGLLEDYPSMDAFFRDASLKGVTAPDGSVKRYAPGTIEKWYRAYKSGGFDALLPTGLYMCIPTINIGCGLAHTADIQWNTAQIANILNETDAATIATAIYCYGWMG